MEDYYKTRDFLYDLYEKGLIQEYYQNLKNIASWFFSELTKDNEISDIDIIEMMRLYIVYRNDEE